ncbi:uncharacterized protein LOC131318565 isoform X2 [Rhododendron vialii]|uniref:uncharacterized protein LOC131318565 isoform X2 n=1 Tax=Rhododendron vialii TaxID=182163 RepID=UPI00265E235C|nr:uncharacterized protein LOC131318565 isoform X2 [Rhododendron vialii]
MGSLETGLSLKRDESRIERHPFGQKPRSRFMKFVLFKKIGYLQWVCTVAVFFFFVVIFQMFLPGLVMEKSENSWKGREVDSGDSMVWKEFGRLDFGEGVKFEPLNLLGKFRKESREVNLSSVGRSGVGFGYRKPQLALVFADLLFDPQQILMATVAVAFREIGYQITVYSLEDGPVLAVWKNIGVPVTLIKTREKKDVVVDWLNYDGIIVSSVEAREVFSSLLQEPFKSVPVIWTIHERTLGFRLRQYVSSGQVELVNDWKKFINRATVVVFPSYALPMLYSECDSGNYYVIPGSPVEAWEADHFKAITQNLRYPKNTVRHFSGTEDAKAVLSVADLVIYGSFLEEQAFPDILIKAMCFGKPIIAPDISMIRKYVDDRVNGYLFPKGNLKVLTQILLQVVSQGKLSPLACNIASIGERTAKNLMVSETVEGYASLVEYILKLPSEAVPSKAVSEIPRKLKEEWQWQLFESILDSANLNGSSKSHKFLEEIEKQWNGTRTESSGAVTITNETFVYSIWEEEKNIEMASARKRREEEELKDRTDQPRGTWEDVYRSAKRADRYKNDLHERDDGELERSGQPLCIYEPYFGEGTWPFLHRTSLYRGLGLSTKGRRPRTDDIDAPSRLPLLNNPYYRDALVEYGAFFAIANRVDRIHKNAWIGFQSWRATARKESLSKTAETALVDAIQSQRHGDTLYFWIRMDTDPRNPLQQDFWTFCDAINAGHCKFAFSEALKKMYGINHNWTSLPPMPIDGDTWSVMHSWVLPTRSFLEFVMFSRMFVDALDTQFYDDNQSGHCCLSLYKDKHCYSRLLELLINVWAYHSARKMVYVNPDTGLMREHHKLKNRRGQMWVKWFSYATVKGMDEDLAEELDSDHPQKRRLWPSTGEVFWQGMYEKERTQRNRDKEKRKKQSKDKISRIRSRHHQKTIGKYVKPLPEAMEVSNSTVVVARLLR